MNNLDFIKVLKFIEENIRVTDQTTIEYLDPKGHIERLNSNQNQIIFGRRGSGKSLLIKSLKEKKNDAISITINLEDFKDISFPDSIIQVLKSLIIQLKKELKKKRNIFYLTSWITSRRLSKKYSTILKSLELQLKQPDAFEESIKEKSGSKISGAAKSGLLNSTAALASEISAEKETSKAFKIDKLNILKNELPNFKDLIKQTSLLLEKNLYLILDDFYFIRKSDQPYFIDFFHRLSKNTPLYLKVATIKHRSSLYLQGDTYVGVEIGHDAQALNLDYSLEDFNALVQFMRDLLKHINKKVGVEFNYNSIITDNAFRFLCLASGGVPRDFFSLFIALGNKIVDENKTISKPNVIDCSIANLPNKFDAFKTDSAEEKEVLEHYLNYLKHDIIEVKKWNSFLVSNSDITLFPQISQALKELVDLRLLHIVNSNTSAAPSDGLRYSAYMVDIGLFPNSNPRNFQQIEPGQKDEKGREDKIRSAPRLNLEKFKSFISELNLKKDLKLTE